jgi:hypothetical protein
LFVKQEIAFANKWIGVVAQNKFWLTISSKTSIATGAITACSWNGASQSVCAWFIMNTWIWNWCVVFTGKIVMTNGCCWGWSGGGSRGSRRTTSVIENGFAMTIKPHG